MKLDDKARDKVSAERWNALWNLVISQGDHNAEGISELYKTVEEGSVNDASTVNGHTVKSDVPENAVFTDTVYQHPESHPAIGMPTPSSLQIHIIYRHRFPEPQQA